MSKIPEKIAELNEALNKLSGTNTFENAKDTVNSLIQLLGIEDEPIWRTFTDTNGRIVSNGAWLKKAEGFADRRGAYKLNIDEKFNIDLKAYWVNKKIDKSKISMLVALTPNFEDEPFYSSKNIGIDFIIPEVPDRITVVLSKNYIIRTVELHESLSVTQQEIFAKWLKINDFSNKSKLHELLWQSFDLEPVNKQFYKGICEFFTELKQHLVSEDVFDARHAAYFTNRLIGRIVFCRFLDKKGIINPVMKYFETEGKDSTEYYKDKLETLFFNVFNTPIDDRQVGSDDKTPFLNGGLFEIKENDKYQDDKLTFPTDYFTRLFEFLKHYNFTTDESTSSFQQVAIDPEMLGKIFENLLAEQVEETGQQARKAKGAFYTPREIVDYMCKESLREYLKTKVTEARDRDDKISLLLDTKPHLWRDQQRNYVKDLEPFKIEIFKALDSVKILDPACGSGAFPMGMMQLLLMCYERLEPRFDPYSTKLSIIKNNLYGVDIEPMAVEISRLRAWLSIIVDKEGDIRKIEPLPNLDFKFICANSLIPLDKSGQMNLMDDTDLEDKITALRDKYYDEKTVKGKNKLRQEFESLISAKEFGMEKSKKQEQLESYHPFDSENICQFFDPEFMFSLDGFDVVIGNPPYFSLSKNEDLKQLSNTYDTYSSTGDVYALFIELGSRILKKNGFETFIVSNKWLRANYGIKLRNYIVKRTNPRLIIDFGQNLLFGEAIVHTAIIMTEKDNNNNVMKGVRFPDNYDFVNGSPISEYISKNMINELRVDEGIWNIITNNKLVLKQKAEEVGKPLKKWNIKINFGLKTGLNEAFIISEKVKNDICNDDSFALSFIKPILRGRDTRKYRCDYKKYWIINVEKGFTIKSQKQNPMVREVPPRYGNLPYDDAWEWFSQQLPSVAKHLLKHKDKATARMDQGDFWWELRACAYIEEFEKPKIIFSEIVSSPQFYYDEENYYPEATVFFISGENLKYITALLNSKPVTYLFQNFYMGGELVNKIRYKKNFLEQVPLPVPSEKIETKINILVDKIQIMKRKNADAETNELENQINLMVYKLYELTYDEVKIIDPEIEKIINQADYEKVEII
jgi:hypothetical protein